MKKIFSTIIAMLLPLMASATYINEINYDFNSSTKTATVIQASYSGNINIRSHVTYSGVTYTVTSIGKEAFSNSDITSVTIPSTVTFINKRAFGGCTKLTSVNIPNSVTEIAAAAFYGSTALKNIVLPSGLKKIDENLFWGCTSLTSVTIPAGVTSIGEEAFRECLALPSITIPYSVTKIDDRAFEDCSSLKYIISEIQTPFAIPDNVFNGIPSNATFTVPAGTKTVYKATTGWNKCQNIVEVEKKRTIHVATAGTLPNLLTEYEKCLLEELTITGNLNGTDIACIRRMAGAPVDDTLSGNVIEKTSGIIYGKLTVLDISGATIVSGGNYYYCLWDYAGPDGWEDYAWYYTYNNTVSSYMFKDCKLTKVVLPNYITSIGNSVFKNCSGLTSMDIPNSVTSIDGYAFQYCSGLTSIIIPNSVTSISDGTFWGCKGLTSVTIPNSVTLIGNAAFSGCSGLTSIDIPNSVKSILSLAFDECLGLRSVTIPNSVTNISDNAFSTDWNISSVVSEVKNPFIISDRVFGSHIVSSATLMVPAGTKSLYQSTSGWNKFQNIRELDYGDVNIDFEVNQADLDATTSYIMGEKSEGFHKSLADLDDDDKVNAADVVKLVTILNLQDGLSTDWQTNYSNQVISSLSCTLNNDGDKAVQLTKCELYCNQSLVSSANFKMTLASGGSKKCSFDDLASYSTKTGFSVVWYYTYNGASYTYRCDLSE